MTLDEIIKLFEDIEAGNEKQLLGYRLHFGVRQATRLGWFNRYSGKNDKFSDFLKALQEHENPLPPADRVSTRESVANTK